MSKIQEICKCIYLYTGKTCGCFYFSVKSWDFSERSVKMSVWTGFRTKQVVWDTTRLLKFEFCRIYGKMKALFDAFSLCHIFKVHSLCLKIVFGVQYKILLCQRTFAESITKLTMFQKRMFCVRKCLTGTLMQKISFLLIKMSK